MDSTMQDAPLLITGLLRHGAGMHPDSTVVEYDPAGEGRRRGFADVAVDAGRMAHALARLGVREGDRVATLCWNTAAHLVAYLAVPAMGAVLHTLNLRLSDEQLRFIVAHAEDRVVIVDPDLLPQLARVLGPGTGVRDVVVVSDGAPIDASGLPHGVAVHDLDALLDTEAEGFDWPELDERSAATLCYTTGTTGDPKGVAYSHRSTVLHTYAISTADAYGFAEADVVLPVVPMFHADAWGLPYAAWLAGSTIALPGRNLQAEHLARFIEQEAVTIAAAVPTVWTTLDVAAEQQGRDLSSLRVAVSGGSPLTEALLESVQRHHGVTLCQGWGMTETSPLITFSRVPAGVTGAEARRTLARRGQLVPGVRARIVDEAGAELPWDGTGQGEVELRGATVTGSYYRADAADPGFHDGWLRTGDLGVIHRGGWVELRDRKKDGIKSGGEWISSVELEAELSAHPAVAEVAVIAVPDERWVERPLAVVRSRAGAVADPVDLRAFLGGRSVPRWWVPEHWASVAELPRTSVGKIDKKRLRSDHAEGLLEVRIVTGRVPAGAPEPVRPR